MPCPPFGRKTNYDLSLNLRLYTNSLKHDVLHLNFTPKKAYVWSNSGDPKKRFYILGLIMSPFFLETFWNTPESLVYYLFSL